MEAYDCTEFPDFCEWFKSEESNGINLKAVLFEITHATDWDTALQGDPISVNLWRKGLIFLFNYWRWKQYKEKEAISEFYMIPDHDGIV